MKKRLIGLMTVLIIVIMAFSGCKGDTNDNGSGGSSGKSGDKKKSETMAVVKSFDQIDTEGMDDLPLHLESVTLYDDGSVKVVPLDEVKEIAETNDELQDGAAYPFKDIGEVEDIFLVRFGNGGYRTVIALMDDGTLSVISAKNLIEEHILVVMPNVSGRDSYTSIKQTEGEDGFGVVGVTDSGEEIELDYSLDF